MYCMNMYVMSRKHLSCCCKRKYTAYAKRCTILHYRTDFLSAREHVGTSHFWISNKKFQ